MDYRKVRISTPDLSFLEDIDSLYSTAIKHPDLGSVMVWDRKSASGKGHLYFCDDSIDAKAH